MDMAVFVRELFDEAKATLANPDVPRLPLDMSRWEAQTTVVSIGVNDVTAPDGSGWWLVSTESWSDSPSEHSPGGCGVICTWARLRKAGA